MQWTAEKHGKAGELAETHHQFDYAAHEYFLAAKKFAREGDPRQSERMVERQKAALARLVTLFESAEGYHAQAMEWTSFAVAARDSRERTVELRDLAAALFEQAADRYTALSEQMPGGARKKDLLRKAGAALEMARVNLGDAQDCDCAPWRGEAIRELEVKANRLLWEAAQEASPELESSPAMRPRSPQDYYYDHPEGINVRLLFTWLEKLGRPRCGKCNRLWRSYSEAAQRYMAFIEREDRSTTKENSFRVLLDEKWQALRNILDHEADAHRSVQPSPLISKARAS
jgi:hypothetical protein